jgi:FlaA1/EpsC-like NDP-sugar epimerase
MLDGQTILITGGTGSIGQALIRELLKQHPLLGRIIVFSRDEQKQLMLRQAWPAAQYPQLQFVLGDIRDLHSLMRACRGVDAIIHTAAIKHVPLAEANPLECIKTNVLGTDNVVQAALDCGVQRIVAVSSDKAAAPVNLYGASKLCADKLVVAASTLANLGDTRFSVVRFGNFFGSRGSVAPLFVQQRASGVLTLTHPEMTRFHIGLGEAARHTLYALENAWGGEIFVPRIPSFYVRDLAAAIAPEAEVRTIGLRPGEKLHEEMITETDAHTTLEFADYFVIAPLAPNWSVSDYLQHFGGQVYASRARYASETNDQWLGVDNLRALVEAELLHPASNLEIT